LTFADSSNLLFKVHRLVRDNNLGLTRLIWTVTCGCLHSLRTTLKAYNVFLGAWGNF